MPNALHCPACAAKLRAPDKMAGRAMRCPKCGTAVMIPGPGQADFRPDRADATPQRYQHSEPPTGRPAVRATPIRVKAESRDGSGPRARRRVAEGLPTSDPSLAPRSSRKARGLGAATFALGCLSLWASRTPSLSVVLAVAGYSFGIWVLLLALVRRSPGARLAFAGTGLCTLSLIICFGSTGAPHDGASPVVEALAERGRTSRADVVEVAKERTPAAGAPAPQLMSPAPSHQQSDAKPETSLPGPDLHRHQPQAIENEEERQKLALGAIKPAGPAPGEAEADHGKRLADAKKFQEVAARQPWAADLQPIPATVIDKGILRNVPYLSFRAGDFEVNVYGDPADPACLEVGIYKSLLRNQAAKKQCLEFMAAVLNDPADRAVLKSLNQTKDLKKRDGLTFEVTLETAEDAYGGWWVSVYDERRLDGSRASAKELAAITVPRAKVPVERFVGRWRIVDQEGRISTYFTLARSLDAQKSHAPDAPGKWEVVGGEARITWTDGWQDILRPIDGGIVLKLAFGPGTSWGDKPANTQLAVKESNLAGGSGVGQPVQGSGGGVPSSWSAGQLALARPGGKSVYVHGYTRKDGTYVHSHTRAAPGSGGGRRR